MARQLSALGLAPEWARGTSSRRKLEAAASSLPWPEQRTLRGRVASRYESVIVIVSVHRFEHQKAGLGRQTITVVLRQRQDRGSLSFVEEISRVPNLWSACLGAHCPDSLGVCLAILNIRRLPQFFRLAPRPLSVVHRAPR
jgi:hypothetical protein